MKVGIIRFPGSNCDIDTAKYFNKFGHSTILIWYRETFLPLIDLLILPGGFAFGDRVYHKATEDYKIQPGVLAVASPIMEIVRKEAQSGLPILGICNGFQILIQAGLLPGELLQNVNKTFYCNHVECKFTGSFFNDESIINEKYDIPVAHGYGKYIPTPETIPFLEYIDNPNGSINNIAGVCNSEQTIFGMMPHPERSNHGDRFMKSIENYVR